MMQSNIFPKKIGISLKAAALLVLIFLTFILFRTLQRANANKTLSTISSILRNEANTANTYAISKAFSDIESLGIVNCTVIEDGGTSRRVFYDTSMNSRCAIGSPMEPYFTASAAVMAINGLSYNIKIQPKIDYSNIILELIAYLSIIIAFHQISSFVARNRLKTEARIRAIELEKQLLLDHTSQIRHDIASPLSAVNILLNLVPSMDREVHAVLIRALHRTQELINDLSVVSKSSSNAHLNPSLQSLLVKDVLKDLFEEKKVLFSNSPSLKFNLDHKAEGAAVLVDQKEIGRVLSNLINNAFEALPDEAGEITLGSRVENNTVSIYIMDNGSGIPAHIIDKVGDKGFTYGKEELEKSGSGLGLYHAKKSIESWQGKMEIQSTEGIGTLVRIFLPLHPFNS